MLFEIIDKSGKTVMETHSELAIPDTETLLDMKSAGFKFRLDGKAYTVAKAAKRGKKKNDD